MSAHRLIAAAVSAALTWLVSLSVLLGLFSGESTFVTVWLGLDGSIAPHAIGLPQAMLVAGIMAAVGALLALDGQRR